MKNDKKCMENKIFMIDDSNNSKQGSNQRNLVITEKKYVQIKLSNCIQRSGI